MTDKRKKQSNSVVPFAIIIVLLAVIVLILIVWAIKVALNIDKKDIGRSKFHNNDTSSLQEAADDFDPALLTKNYVYADISQDELKRGYLAVNLSDTPSQPADDLTGVYPKLFNGEGIQIISAKDARAEGSEEMLDALNQMLSDYFSESGKTSLMIDKAYSPIADSVDSTDEDNYYENDLYDEYGNYIGYMDSQDDSYDDAMIEEKCSGHESGYDIDLSLYIKETNGFRALNGSEEYKWLDQNAYKYGFVQRYSENDADISHYRYVGLAAAAVMKKENLGIEEFSEYIKGYSFDRPLMVKTKNGSQLLYYIANSQMDLTTVQIPADNDGNTCRYDISGNNSDGYIVTVMPSVDFIESVSTKSADDVSSGSISE